ncbi:hypothetical protein BJY21_004430 [Kineosphaera limosa]|uniref:Ribonuclease VapC n=1 Tax=Kineosphaera limosa NBRC 100340 TaxID=1184609 RepID=K6WAJ8_9MICO|nr:PIN domain-containing protein [Kineosphaera limosa]NYE03246.1 hypothetical protein [Kineosphaera limosa]GAB96230.1 hypothetical protein KILIM_033_00500 [Kineosphaera limosa NBRC 100340]
MYLDTSALVPILIAEPSTAKCRLVWSSADHRVTSRLAFVETAAALAAARRQSRISEDEHAEAWANFVGMWSELNVVEVSEALATDAANLASSLALRGYDAMHCASAVKLQAADLVAAAGDAQLLAAWQASGIAVIDINQ